MTTLGALPSNAQVGYGDITSAESNKPATGNISPGASWLDVTGATYTTSVAGDWLIIASFRMGTSGAGLTLGRILVDGSEAAYAILLIGPNAYSTAAASVIVTGLASGKVIKLQGYYSGSGTPQVAADGTRMVVVQLG